MNSKWQRAGQQVKPGLKIVGKLALLTALRYGPAGVHRMFLRPPLGLPFSSWRQLRTKMRTISSTS